MDNHGDNFMEEQQTAQHTEDDCNAVLSPAATQVSKGVQPELYLDDDKLEEDEESPGEEDQFQGDENEIRTRQKLNSEANISSLRVKPFSSSRFNIPLSRLLAMAMVRPTLSTDLAKPDQEFVHGYKEGA
ncbi:hypothetical protein M758_UG029100 [Ceratodon purpureus]|nr:hypothetical protein M758_UG029100 [Ceratodon purpureus]